MKRHSLFLAPLLLAAACGAQETTPSEANPTEASHGVASEEAPKAPEFVAVITSKSSKVVATDFEGRILKMHVTSGQMVKSGDVIAELDTTELKSKLAEAQGRKQQAAGQAGRAYAMASQARHAANLERRLIASGASTREGWVKANAEASAAGAEGGAAAGEMASAQATITELEREISLAKVTAPIDGVVSVQKAHEGEVAHKGMPLARVFDPDQLEVKFAVPHVSKDFVKEGLEVDLELERGIHVKAKVTKITDDHDPNVDFYIAEADFDASVSRTGEIHAGAGGHVRIADKGATR